MREHGTKHLLVQGQQKTLEKEVKYIQAIVCWERLTIKKIFYRNLILTKAVTKNYMQI